MFYLLSPATQPYYINLLSFPGTGSLPVNSPFPMLGSAIAKPQLNTPLPLKTGTGKMPSRGLSPRTLLACPTPKVPFWCFHSSVSTPQGVLLWAPRAKDPQSHPVLTSNSLSLTYFLVSREDWAELSTHGLNKNGAWKGNWVGRSGPKAHGYLCSHVTTT